MKRILPFFLLLCVIVGACDSYDDFTTDPSLLLTFSAETVEFDTVITAEGSSTRTLMVSNRGDEGLRIVAVEFEKGSASPFRANVDGVFLDGGRGTDFEVRTRDSIFVRLECTLPETDKDETTTYEDRLLFHLESGVTQSVSVTAIGMDVYRWTDVTLTEDMTLESGRPVLVDGPLTVSEDVTFTIKAGTRLFFRDNGSLIVRGTLKVEGEEDRPVVLRGDRTDRLLWYMPYDNMPDRWNGIVLTNGSKGHEIKWMDLHSSRWGIRAENTDLSMQSSRLHNISGITAETSFGIYLKNCDFTADNVCISNAMGHALYLLGGKASLTHCTMAQYLLIGGGSMGMALFLANKDGDTDYDIDSYTFSRCLVMGYGDDVISASFQHPGTMEEPLSFNECYLNTVHDPSDERFVDCLYDSEEAEKRGNKGLSPDKRGLYRLFNTTLYLYDFTPAPGSPCEGYGAAF